MISSKLTKTIINQHFPNAEILVSYDGMDVVKQYYEQLPEVVLMDIHLPEKTVWELFRI